MTRNERIKFVLDRKNIGYEKLADRLAVTKGAISNRLNREKEIDDLDFLNAVALEVNLEGKSWGDGKKFTEDDFDEALEREIAKFSFTSKSNKPSAFEVELEQYKKAFNDQRDQKLRLEVELESVKKQLAAKDETIAAKNELIENLKTKVAEQLEDIKLLTSQIKDKL